MILGILSDTHGYLHPAFKELFKDADYILHAGDIGTPEVLQQLEAIAPTIAVRGNIDGEVFYDVVHYAVDDLYGYKDTILCLIAKRS